jgi:hypothetical protein
MNTDARCPLVTVPAMAGCRAAREDGSVIPPLALLITNTPPPMASVTSGFGRCQGAERLVLAHRGIPRPSYRGG